MNIDIRTLAIVMTMTNVLQAIAIFLQYLINKSYRGIGWWVLGSAMTAMGYILLSLRDIIPIALITIIFANTLIVSGPIFLYIGIMRFLDRKESRGVISSIFSAFVLSFLYFTYVDNNITMRTAVVYTAVAVIALLNARSLLAGRSRSVSASERFLAMIFLVFGCFLVIRAAVTLAVDPVNSLFTPTLMQTISFLVFFAEGNLMAFGLIIMVNQRLHSEIREAKEHVELIFSTGPDAAMISRLNDGVVVNINEGFTALTGYSRNETIGKSILDINIWKDLAERKKFLQELREKGFCENLEAVFLRKDGSQSTGMLSAKIITLNTIAHVVSIVRDITERKRMEERLRDSENRYRELSMIDDLTQLYNSRYFYHRLGMEIDRVNRYGEPLTLLLLDIDNFKAFNDAYGHVEGDNVLVRLGQVVNRCLRQTDSAYRYGGEEFTMMLPMTASADGVVTADRIRTEFKKENFSPVAGEDVHLTVSIGLAQYKAQEDMKAFVHRVDLLMYRGKKNGKDRICSEL